jgi:hypothetical protein
MQTLLMLVLLAAAGGPLSAEGRSWIADSDADAVWLIYGTPESDDILLSLTCERTAKTLTVWFATEPVAKDPKSLPMELVSDGGRAQIVGNGSRSEMDDAFALEAKTALTPEWEKLLTGGKTLSVQVEGGKQAIPLDDTAQQGVAEIVKACRQ